MILVFNYKLLRLPNLDKILHAGLFLSLSVSLSDNVLSLPLGSCSPNTMALVKHEQVLPLVTHSLSLCCRYC